MTSNESTRAALFAIGAFTVVLIFLGGVAPKDVQTCMDAKGWSKERCLEVLS